MTFRDIEDAQGFLLDLQVSTKEVRYCNSPGATGINSMESEFVVLSTRKENQKDDPGLLGLARANVQGLHGREKQNLQEPVKKAWG